MGRKPKSTAAQNKRNASLFAYNQHMLALAQAQALAHTHAHALTHNPAYINPHSTPLPAVCSPPLPDASDNTFSSLTNTTIYPPQWSASLARAARHHSAPFLKENVSLTSLEGLAVAALVNGTFIPTSSKTNPTVPPPHPAHSQRPSANIPILSISRIVNPSLEQSFETRRRDLLRRKSRSHRVLKACGMSDEEIAARLQSDYEFDDTMKRTTPLPEYSDNPALLFHCTKSNVDDILRQGLDQRLGAGGLLGRGLYFADAVGKSLNYDQNSTILIFSVILGDCVFVPGGNQTYVREPPKADCQKRNKDDLFFDSIVGRPAAHNEYVIYRSDQCLPLYAISYSRGQPHAPVVYPLPPFTWNSPNTPLSPPISTHPWPHSPIYVFDAMIDPFLSTPKPANSPSKLITSLASSSTSASSTTPVRPRPPRKQVSKSTPSPKPASYKVGSTTVFLDFDDDDDDILPTPTNSRFTKPNHSSSSAARTKRGPWTCAGCSFINDFDRTACELCRVVRYPAGSSGKTDGESGVVVLDGAKNDGCSPRDFTGKVESLVRMGFLNQRKNRKAVSEANGDIEKAVAILRAEEAQGQISGEKEMGVALTVAIEDDDVEVVCGKENEVKKDDSCSKRKANAVVDIDDDIGVVTAVGSGTSSSSTRVPTPQKRRAFFQSRLAAYSSSDCLLISSDHDEPIVVDLTGPYKPNQAGPSEEENQVEESAIAEPSAPVLVVEPEPEEIDCGICTGSFKESEFTKLQCNHSLCNTCFSQISISGTTMTCVRQDFIKCPWCKHTQGVEIGDCPDGTMSLTYMKGALHGHQHDSTQTIVIDYIVKHPTHLQTHRRAFLPDNVEGRDVLRRMQIAWDRRLVLRVGTSATSGLSDVLVWNLHHKTGVHGGVAAYGYPDETYLQRVGEELRERGVL